MADAVDRAGVARIGSNGLPAASVTVGPGVLVEVARPGWERGERGSAQVLGARPWVDQVEDLASVTGIEAHEQIVGL